ncbi:MAG: DUF1667 domain-containing protein [Promethearchaeota archaeon]
MDSSLLTSKNQERKDEREIICVVCPNSCRLTVWKDSEDNVQISGNKCARGLTYGENEYLHPVRMVITTMRIEGASFPVIPVRSEEPIPKDLIFQAIKIINKNKCRSPIKVGDILIENILDTKINIIASRSML